MPVSSSHPIASRVRVTGRVADPLLAAKNKLDRAALR